MLFKTASSSSVQLGADDWSTTDYSTPLEASAVRVGRPNTRVVEAKLGTLDVLIYCDSDELNLSPKKGAIAVTLYKNIWCEVVREKRGEDKHKQCYLVRKVPEAHEYDLLDYEGRSLPRWEKRYEEAHARKALAQAAEEHAQCYTLGLSQCHALRLSFRSHPHVYYRPVLPSTGLIGLCRDLDT